MTPWTVAHQVSLSMGIFQAIILDQVSAPAPWKQPLRKDLHHPYNHDGVITDLEPDILECEVKWALGSIIRNKASGGDGIPVELFHPSVNRDPSGRSRCPWKH